MRMAERITLQANLRLATEALRLIQRVGTHTETRRIGDAWTTAGWEQYDVESNEAQIARECLERIA